ncbi:MAG: polyphosphate polymerase domain-containing protein [Galactobacter sp.]|uniref:polyphosphate polymerase domain-containing protein n=1 Tax=Galactobacter sp. TaxID=2676125 RepID=UPI0025B9AD97|nr:polyphosphate polymerase domain-containing protein [Galactobacter sp.]
MTATGLMEFTAIGLEELNATAALQTRRDRKYLVPQAQLQQTLSELPAETRILTMDGLTGFDYDSVYFDTAEWESYCRTARRRRRRFKLRTRLYVDSGDAFLELKTKNGRGQTVKDRIAYSPEDLQRLTPARSYVAAGLAPLGLTAETVETLRPCLRTTYRRSTLLTPEGARATIDTALMFSDPLDPQAGQVTLNDWVVVETKSASAPSALDRALWRRGHRPSGISKFGVGLAVLHPELPHNKWHRVLNGPFSRLRPARADPSPELSPSSPRFSATTELKDRP